jgi:hypothetical protein
LIRTTETGFAEVALTAVAAILLTCTEVHPLWVLGAGAATGWLLRL